MSRSVILVRLVVCMVLLLSLVSSIGTTSIHAATFTVTKTADTNDGTCDTDCSLREAIAAANTNPGADTIEFNIPTSDPGWDTVEFPGAFILPFTMINITETLTIDGWSQANNTGDTNTSISESETGPISNNSTTGPEIIINGFSNNNALFQVYGSDVVIRGLGIYYNMFNSLAGNRVIQAWTGADNLTISDNTFVSNAGGVFRNLAEVSNLKIINNIFRQNLGAGLDVLELQFATLNGAEIRGNTFVGNEASAIQLAAHHGTNPIIISHNLFKANGQNTTESKSHIYTGSANTSQIIIEYNTFTQTPTKSVIIRSDNRVTIRKNRFLDIDKQGIDLTLDLNPLSQGDGLTINDPHDLDTGPNDLMNYPIIDKVDYLGGDRYFIKGYLDGNKLEAPYTKLDPVSRTTVRC